MDFSVSITASFCACFLLSVYQIFAAQEHPTDIASAFVIMVLALGVCLVIGLVSPFEGDCNILQAVYSPSRWRLMFFILAIYDNSATHTWRTG